MLASDALQDLGTNAPGVGNTDENSQDSLFVSSWGEQGISDVLPALIPSDPVFGHQDHHRLLQTAEAWEITRGSDDVLIAVLDSGFDLEHEDLAVLETQVLTFTRVPTSGSFSLQFGSERTSELPFSSSDLEIQAALLALEGIPDRGIEVFGDYETGFTVTFTGLLAGIDFELLSVSTTANFDSEITVLGDTEGHSVFALNPDDPINGVDEDDAGQYSDDYRGWNVYDDSNDILPIRRLDSSRRSHGTAMASLIAAMTDNAVGIAGVADHLRVLPVRIVDSETGRTGSELVAKGIEYALKRGAQIINISWEIDPADAVLDGVIQQAYDAGALIVVAAGNGGSDAVGDSNRARLSDPRVLYVTNTGPDDVKSPSADFGRGVDLTAPGTSLPYAIDEFPFYANGSGSQRHRLPSSRRSPVSFGQKLQRCRATKLRHPSSRPLMKLCPCPQMRDTALLLGAGRVNALRALTDSARAPKLESFETGRGADGFINEFRFYFDQPLDFDGQDADKFLLQSSGGDGSFDEGNETEILFAIEEYAFGSEAIVLYPTEPLRNDQYRIVVKGGTSGIQNTFGISMASDVAHEFSVGGAP